MPPDPSLAAVQTALASTSLTSYLSSRPPTTVVTVSDADRLETVLAVFTSRKILSAPVFKAGSSVCFGFISVADVLRAVLSWASIGTDATPASRAEGLARAGARLARERVRDVPRSNDGALLWRAADGSMSLLDVVRHGFLRGGSAPPVHRVAVYDVLDDEGGGVENPDTDASPSPALAGAPIRVVAMLSQTNIAAFIAKHAPASLGPLATARLGDLGIASAPVVSVPQGMPAAHAFAALLARGGEVSAAAVVATGEPGCVDGSVLGDVSVSSLRGLSSARVPSLASPILDFLRAPASTPGDADAAGAWGVRGADAAPAPLAAVAPARVAPGAPFEKLLTLVAGGGARQHRAYVVDAEGRPQGIISLTDVLRLVSRS